MCMKIFYLNLAVSILLTVGGFLVPPRGVIDGSVLTAVGELFMFSVLAQVPVILDAARKGRSIKVSKGDFAVDVSAAAAKGTAEE